MANHGHRFGAKITPAKTTQHQCKCKNGKCSGDCECKRTGKKSGSCKCGSGYCSCKNH